eukprot:CAMPEP_0117600134 /NCGR_PEP_ID=MMETSP0784-20121206/76315_1 /TAXON_ID=39447 /ORGANISM="" /LENGTH=98 /DNA_ID=CAMNT_0005402725 /DNA_START=256 /DNA_END=552 /DNA_ORIENTATION=+
MSEVRDMQQLPSQRQILGLRIAAPQPRQRSPHNQLEQLASPGAEPRALRHADREAVHDTCQGGLRGLGQVALRDPRRRQSRAIAKPLEFFDQGIWERL